jgi:hypothetical protein
MTRLPPSALRLTGLLGLVLLLAVAGPAEGQSRVSGIVTDGETGTPVAGAQVVLQGDRQITRQTDAEGRFILDGMDPGPHVFTVRHLAYEDVEAHIEVAGGGRVTNVAVELLREAIALSPIVVEVDRRPTMGPLRQVYERVDHMRLLGQGRIFDREELERWGASRVSDVMRMVPGVRVDRGNIVLNTTCRGAPLYYLDGAPLRLGAETIDDWVPAHEIEVIEVYRRVSEISGEFGGSAAQCGVIAIWTRRGP